MKTALCLSGNLRTFEQTFPSIKQNIIDPLNCDVFIYTPNKIGAPTRKTAGDVECQNIQTDLLYDNIVGMFNPKKIVIEEENTQRFINMSKDIKIRPNEKMFIAGHLGYHIAMFYYIFMCNQIKIRYEMENNFVYDRVIRFRPDIKMNTKLDHSMFPDNNKIYLPEIAQYCNEGLNDQMAIGSSNSMNIYAELYNHVISYYKNHTTTARPEAMVRYHLCKNGIKFETRNIQYDIYRLSGEIYKQYKMHGENGGRWD
jgi:hypothetical protein